MRRTFSVLLFLVFSVSAVQAAENLVVKESQHSVSETLDRLSAIMKEKGITVFTRIDHAAGAKKAGIDLKPTQVLIFGNPKLGTPLMQANRQIGVDLPLKALAWEDDAGKVWLGYTKPEALKQRFGISERDEVFNKMTGALDKLTSAATKAK